MDDFFFLLEGFTQLKIIITIVMKHLVCVGKWNFHWNPNNSEYQRMIPVSGLGLTDFCDKRHIVSSCRNTDVVGFLFVLLTCFLKSNLS